MGHNARFNAGGSCRGSEESGAADPIFFQQLLELFRRAVLSYNAKQFRRQVERSKVPSDIGRAARHEAFPLEIYDGHGGFGRNPRDVAPNEMIDHDVAENQYARLAGSGKNATGAGS